MIKSSAVAKWRISATALACCTLIQAGHAQSDNRGAALRETEAPVLSMPIQRGDTWIVEAKTADGSTHRLLLDTGAAFNVFGLQGPLAPTPLTHEAEQTLLKQGTLRNPIKGIVELNAISSSKSTTLGLSPALRIQGWSLPAGKLAMREDPAAISAAGDATFEGILGADSMRELTWRGDHIAGTLAGYAGAAPAHDWQQCVFMGLDPEQRLPILEVGFADNSRFVILDTGAELDISLPKETFNALSRAKRFAGMGSTFQIDITNQITERPVGLLPGLKIGQQTLPKLAATSGSTWPRVGTGLLAKMDRFEIDLRHYRFCFDLSPKAMDSGLDSAGAALLRKDTRYAIAAISRKGRMGLSGAKVGDLITMVGQRSTDKLSYDDIYAMLVDPAVTQITVERGGHTKVIALKAPLKPR